mmetsp:Transcript_2168/g.1734  ORF Transcript_2168/g.1734 Transcript_2168/m.1734 type:complete len:100 (+) Transcript_2168:493-792(+)
MAAHWQWQDSRWTKSEGVGELQNADHQGGPATDEAEALHDFWYKGDSKEHKACDTPAQPEEQPTVTSNDTVSKAEHYYIGGPEPGEEPMGFEKFWQVAR